MAYSKCIAQGCKRRECGIWVKLCIIHGVLFRHWIINGGNHKLDQFGLPDITWEEFEEQWIMSTNSIDS